ncbi:MAG: cytochrome c [Acidobacteriota bacterium]
MSTTRNRRLASAIFVISLVLSVSACRQDMHDQPKLKTYREGANRSPVDGTVARGALKDDGLVPKKTAAPAAPAAPATATAAAPAGTASAKVADDFPFAITAEVLSRGQNRFNVYCAPCHSVLGDGNGMIVQRGFRRPPSYNEDRLRNSPASHFFDVMTNGFGAMASYNDKLSPEDRWKVAAYIRALQLSQRATVDDVPASERAKLEAAGSETKSPQAHGGQH